MQAAQEEWGHIPQEVLDSWVDSISRRVQEVLWAHGGHTKGLFGYDGSVPLAHTNDRFLPF